MTLAENTAGTAATIRGLSPPSRLSPPSPMRRTAEESQPGGSAHPRDCGTRGAGAGGRGCRSSLEGPGARRGEADHVLPPPGAAGLAGLAAREPGQPVSPSPRGPAGRTGSARLGRAGVGLPLGITPVVGSPSALPPAVYDSGNSSLPLSSQLLVFPPAGGSAEPAWRPALFGLAEHVSSDLRSFFGLGQFSLTQTREGVEYQGDLHTSSPTHPNRPSSPSSAPLSQAETGELSPLQLA